MNIYNEGKHRLSNMLLWKESVEYQSLCSKHHADCARLISIGKEHLHIIQRNHTEILDSAVSFEFATAGDIHRGFYCPSPVLDLVVGNVHRGRILKRPTVRSKISHRFGFDTNNNLVFAETLEGDKTLSTEYLFIRENCRIGITINSDYVLESISEEVFINKKIVGYSVLNVFPDQGNYFCSNLHIEAYTYDEQGLCSCKKEEFQPYVNALYAYQYDFARENGYLSTYTAKDYPLVKTDTSLTNPPVYIVKTKRKA